MALFTDALPKRAGSDYGPGRFGAGSSAVEHPTFNRVVVGSIPTRPTKTLAANGSWAIAVGDADPSGPHSMLDVERRRLPARPSGGIRAGKRRH